MKELLRGVTLVCDGHPLVAALPHVANTIDDFLWADRAHWTLESSSKNGLLRLMDRLLKHESPAFNQKRRELRLCHAARAAITQMHDVRVVRWWLRRYMPNQEVFPIAEVYKMAIHSGHLPVLEWINEETKGNLPHLQCSQYIKNPDTVAWLLDHGDCYSCGYLRLFELKTLDARFQSIKRCFAYQDVKRSFKIYFAEFALDQALDCGQPEDLQWMYQHRPQLFNTSTHGLYDINLNAVNFLNNAIRYGNIDAAKWLVNTFPLSMFTDPKGTFEHYIANLRPYRFNMAMVKWVLCEFSWRKPRNRCYWLCDARDYAARSGNLEMLEFVYKARMESCKTEQAASRAMRRWGESRSPVMDDAAALGRLDILQFFHRNRSRVYTTAAMNGAAAHGHLNVVQWLHQNRTKGCTTEAMDAAATNGHLKVVQWLHKNRSEGCTTEAMDGAARNGHLNVIQWLHENRSEGFTRIAMDGAAGYGHLSVVQFLHTICHENRVQDNVLRTVTCIPIDTNQRDYCTTSAMDQAASNGHLKVVQWLHENRGEGCTAQAIDLAAEHGHLEIVQWLHENRAEGCTSAAMDKAARHGHWSVVQFLHANRHEGCRTYAKAYVAAENAH